MLKKELYTSPEVKVVDLHIEGVICGSPDISINDWTDDGDPLSF